MKRKKHCTSGTCDAKTLHLAIETDDGRKALWECQNCYKLTARRVRAVAVDAAIDQLFEELSAG